jgi:hypothetical protein
MKTVFAFIVLVFVILGLFHAGNALLIHEQATVLVKPELCPIMGGEVKEGICMVQADLGHSFVYARPMLRLKDGRIVELQEQDVLSYSFTQSKYSFSW